MALPKRPEHRQRRNKRADIGLLGLPPKPGEVEVPKPSKKWSKRTTSEWNDYFESPLIKFVVTKADLPTLRRLFDYRDELRRAMNRYRRERLTTGSTGQIRLSPMADAIARLEKIVAPLEDRFGMTPMARLKLGASLGDAAQSLADINADLDAETDEDDDDPRFDIIIDTSTDERAEGL